MAYRPGAMRTTLGPKGRGPQRRAIKLLLDEAQARKARRGGNLDNNPRTAVNSAWEAVERRTN